MADSPGASENLMGLSRNELEQFAMSCGQPRYRGHQLYQAIYAHRRRDFATVTNLNRSFRECLSAHCRVTYPRVLGQFISRDGTIRYLLGLEDEQAVEAVYMSEEGRTTLCLSSQVGCPLKCRFCFTGQLGSGRNLTAGEIVGQVLALAEAQDLPLKSQLSFVFMGMGEPLLNFDAVMKAVRILTDRKGLAVPLRRVTLSTAGVIPGILDLAREPQRPRLAVSLNAASDEQRTALMPLNRTYPLIELLRACRAYPLRPRERLTFEYVLLDGINDSRADAARVADLVKGIRCKLNLIPYNGGPALSYRPPPLLRTLAFQQILTQRNVPAFIRLSRGQDISAACGQLRLAGLDASLTPAPRS